LSVVQLNTNIDSLKKVTDSFKKRFNREIENQLHYTAITDSSWKIATQKKQPVAKVTPKTFLATLPDSAQLTVFDGAISIANNLRNTFTFTGVEVENKKLDIRFSQIEWHRKFSFSLACLVLFFIGAPLGSIIRKGGMGMPLVVALVFFIIFHLLNIFGEKFAKEEVTSVFFGMWMSIFILAPVGYFFTYKAMHDSQLFNKEFYHRLYKKIAAFTHRMYTAVYKKKNGTFIQQ
jgi:lipopolysaccharide export system permease protein